MGNQYMRRQPTVFWVLAPLVSLLLYLIANEYSLSYGIHIDMDYFGLMMGIVNGSLILFGVCTVGSVIVMIMDVWNNEELGSGGKIGWIAMMIFFNILAFPIYWYLYLRDHYNMSEAKFRKEIMILTILSVGLIVVWCVWFEYFLMIIYEYDFMWIIHYVLEKSMILIYIFMILVYIFIVCGNKTLGVVKKVLWILGVVILGIIFCPVYLVVHIFKGKKEDTGEW